MSCSSSTIEEHQFDDAEFNLYIKFYSDAPSAFILTFFEAISRYVRRHYFPNGACITFDSVDINSSKALADALVQAQRLNGSHLKLSAPVTGLHVEGIGQVNVMQLVWAKQFKWIAQSFTGEVPGCTKQLDIFFKPRPRELMVRGGDCNNHHDFMTRARAIFGDNAAESFKVYEEIQSILSELNEQVDFQFVGETSISRVVHPATSF